MGYGLMVYAVPEAAVQRLRRGDQTLLAELRSHESVAEALSDRAGDFDDEETIGFEAAFDELFTRNYSDPDCGYIYGYAFESFCRFVGRFLRNDGFCPVRFSWYDELDAYLAEHDIPLRFDRFFASGCPLRIPEPDDFPTIGHWTAEETEESALFISERAGRESDPDLKSALLNLEAWTEKLLVDPDQLLIGFHY